MNKRIRVEAHDISTEQNLPIADETAWYVCDSCDNLHVVLRDCKGNNFAVLTLDEKMLNDMLQTIKKGRGLSYDEETGTAH
jgi:hypothetical protein